MPVLAHSPADVVRHLLIALGLGATPAEAGGVTWPVYCAAEPATPDNAITVYDTDGIVDGRSMIDGEVHRHHGFQVRIRSVDHATGWVKANAIQQALEEDIYQETVTVGGTSYLVHNVTKIGSILPLGPEPTSKRRLFTINALVTLEER